MLGNKSFTKFDTQLLLGVLITIFGLALITLSFFVKPVGYIDPTVLTAFGEILTFAGALLGIDANYRIHIHRIKHKDVSANRLPPSVYFTSRLFKITEVISTNAAE